MSKTDSSAAVTTEEIGLEDDTDTLEGTESKQFSSLSATLHYMNLGQVGRAANREGDAHEDGEPDTRKLEETEEDSQVFESIGGSVVGDASMETHDDEVSVDAQIRIWTKGPERNSTSGCTMMTNGTVVKHWSRRQAECASSTAEAECYTVITGAAEGLEAQSMTTEDGLQRSQSDRFRKRSGKTGSIEVKYSWLHEVTKSGRVNMKRVPGEQHLADQLTEGKSCRDVDVFL